MRFFPAMRPDSDGVQKKALQVKVGLSRMAVRADDELKKAAHPGGRLISRALRA